MKRIPKLKKSHKILTLFLIVVIIASVVLLSTQFSAFHDSLNEAVEGGELTITSVGRNHESLTSFIRNNNTGASQLLEAARSALETAKAKFNSAVRTDDDYVRNMVNNYRLLAEASDTMAEGVDSLLIVSDNLTSALGYYVLEDFENATKQAVYCLAILEPLQTKFETSGADLDDMDVTYVPSGQRDRLSHGVDQYRSEMEVYNQIILLLRSIIEGKAYLQMNSELEESMRQLQNAITNKDYSKAQSILQNMTSKLQALRDQAYQNAADLASQLNPDQLGGDSSDIAQELQNRLRDLQGLDAFQNYLQSLEKYLEAMGLFNQGKLDEAQEAVNQGLAILGNGKNMDQELQGMYQGLANAFSSLQLHIKGQPDQG